MNSDLYRVLLFSPGFAPYSFSENLVNSKLALAMLDRGWHIAVLSAPDEGHTYGTQWTEPWLQLQPYTHEVRYGLGVPGVRHAQRLWDSMHLGHAIGGVRWARRALTLALRLHRERPFDLVLSRSVSCYAHLPAIHFAARTGVPWIANWNDPPSYLFPPPYCYPAGPLRRLTWNQYYRRVFASADAHTFPCRRLAEFMMGHFARSEAARGEVIPHLALDRLAPPQSPSDRVFRLCHAGNLSAERNPRNFLVALKRLAADVDGGGDIRLEIIGVEDVSLAAMLRQLELERIVSFAGRMDYLSTLTSIAASAAAVLVEAPCQEGIFLPSKVADYVQVGKPILAVSPKTGTLNDLINQYGGGVAVDCRSAEAILGGLKMLYDAWHNGAIDRYCPSRIRRATSSDAVLDRYESLISELKGRRQASRVHGRTPARASRCASGEKVPCA